MGDIEVFQRFLECVLVASLGGGSPVLVLLEVFPLIEEGFHLGCSPLAPGGNPSPGPELLHLLHRLVGCFPDRFLEALVAVEEAGERLAAGWEHGAKDFVTGGHHVTRSSCHRHRYTSGRREEHSST